MLLTNGSDMWRARASDTLRYWSSQSLCCWRWLVCFRAAGHGVVVCVYVGEGVEQEPLGLFGHGCVLVDHVVEIDGHGDVSDHCRADLKVAALVYALRVRDAGVGAQEEAFVDGAEDGLDVVLDPVDGVLAESGIYRLWLPLDAKVFH